MGQRFVQNTGRIDGGPGEVVPAIPAQGFNAILSELQMKKKAICAGPVSKSLDGKIGGPSHPDRILGGFDAFTVPFENLQSGRKIPESRVGSGLGRGLDIRHSYFHARALVNTSAQSLGKELTPKTNAQVWDPFLHGAPNIPEFLLDPRVRVVDRHGAAHDQQDIGQVRRHTVFWDEDAFEVKARPAKRVVENPGALERYVLEAINLLWRCHGCEPV